MGWDVEDQQFNLSVSLDGVAGQILWDTEACSTVEGTIQLLRNWFGNVNQQERFCAELKSRKRKPGESLQELYQDVCGLMSLAYPGPTSDLSNIVGRDAFLEALCDNALRVRILEKGPPDLDEALRIACQLEAFNGGTLTDEPRPSPADKQRSPKKSNQQYHRQVREDKGRQSDQSQGDVFRQFQDGLKDCLTQMTAYKLEMENLRRNAQEEEAERRRQSSQQMGQGDGAGRGPCFTCGVEGHFARNCPFRKGGKGQSSDQSQSRISPQQEQQQQASARTQYEQRPQLIGQAAKKSTYLTVHWRGKQYNALLDTGCERSVVGKRLLPSGMELSPPSTDLYATNRTKIPLIVCTTINFTVHGKEYSSDLAVTNSVDQLILGIDWLMKNAARWDFERVRIFLGGKWIALQQHVTADRVRRSTAWSRMAS